MSSKQILTVDDIAAILEEENFISADVFIGPPENHTMSDEDSDDDNAVGDINNLSGNQLRASAELRAKQFHPHEGIVDYILDSNSKGLQNVSIQTDQNVSKDETDKLTKQSNIEMNSFRKKQKIIKEQRVWKNVDLEIQDELQWQQPDWLQEELTPVQLFEKFFDEEVLNLLVDSTNKYAMHKGNEKFRTTKNEMKTFISILLLSGYCSVPRYRMYWETSEDSRNIAVSKAMSRNTFESILKYLHVCDNNKLDTADKFTKVRPLWDMLNKKWLSAFPQDAYLCVDEAMVPYYGRHSTKQHLHGKPIRFGYKIWCLCNRLGYIIQGEPYQGASTGNTNPDLGVGGSVVMDLVQKLPPTNRYSIYIDNFFTSVNLLDRLKKEGHFCTGTIRPNRTEGAPLEDVKITKRKPRGSYCQITDHKNGISLVRYNDNNVVTVASTFKGVEPLCKTKRYSAKEKKRIEILQPACINSYNTFMGGVDRLDQNIANYRINIRMKKWYYQLISFPINASINNAWLLYRLTPKGKADNMDLLGFTRYVVQTYLTKYTVRSKPGPSPKALKRRVTDDIRLDGLRHFSVTSSTQVRCAECHKNTTKKCQKCNVGCHSNCFVKFHS